MRGLVYNNNLLAGYLEKDAEKGVIFTYTDEYFDNVKYPQISLSLPKSKKEHVSEHFFSFFFGLLAEGANRDMQNKLYGIDENDEFTRLLITGGNDPIGAITVKPENHELLGML